MHITYRCCINFTSGPLVVNSSVSLLSNSIQERSYCIRIGYPVHFALEFHFAIRIVLMFYCKSVFLYTAITFPSELMFKLTLKIARTDVD